jgi:hypothetical protein
MAQYLSWHDTPEKFDSLFAEQMFDFLGTTWGDARCPDFSPNKIFHDCYFLECVSENRSMTCGNMEPISDVVRSHDVTSDHGR